MDTIRDRRFEHEPEGSDPKRSDRVSSVLVVGVDGSETSWRALYYAFGLARRQRSGVLAVFAGVPAAGVDGSTDHTWSADDALAAELRDAIAALSDETHVAAEFIRIEYEPVASLIRLADERHAEAIIVGASRTLGHRLFGSKAVRTVRRSQCPVTVVP